MDRALLVAIDTYRTPRDRLRFCTRDANDIATFLADTKHFHSVRPLFDADHDAIVEALDALVRETAPGDRALFFFSGHGSQMPVVDPQGGHVEDVLCPANFYWLDDQPMHALRPGELTAMFRRLQPNATLVWISDACYSGGGLRDFPLDPFADALLGGAGRRKANQALPTVVQRATKAIAPPPEVAACIEAMRQSGRGVMPPAPRRNVGLLASCSLEQKAEDGVFVPALLEQLTGQAPQTLHQLAQSTAALLTRQTPYSEGDPAVVNAVFLAPWT